MAPTIGLAFFCALAARAADAQSARAPEPSPPAFRRFFLPADEIKNRDWKDGYPPIDAKEFKRLLETVEAAANGGPGARAAQIEKAEYALELVGEDLLVGGVKLRLARRGDAAGMLLIEPCSLALGAAAWQDRDAKPAVLGTGPDALARVLVEGSQLTCGCSQRGERTASGAVSFRLELPECPITRLTLDAPAGIELTTDQGILSKSVAGAPNTNRWTLELGGHNLVNLRAVAEESASQRRPLTLLRQSLEYEFSSRGIEVAAQLKLDIHGEPLQRIAIDLDPSLRLVAAHYGELDVPWSAVTDVETRVSHVVLQFPEPIDGTGRVVRLVAMAPLVTDKPWRLPGLQSESMSWQEGTATLLIPNSLVLERLATDGCRQSRITALSAPLVGESIEIQYYRPGAMIEVQLAQRRERLKVDNGALVDVSPTDIVSRCHLQLSLARGECPVFQLGVHPGWTVDMVENLESNRPVDWELDDSQPEAAELKIRLESPVTSEHPSRLVVRGSRRLPPGPTFDGGQLGMLDFDAFVSGMRLIGVRAAEGAELNWVASDDLKRRDVLQLTPAESQLFVQPPESLLFADDSGFRQSTMTLKRRRPSYTADIRIDASVQKDVLTERYIFECVPEAARIERLLVHVSQARDVPLEWTLAGGNTGQLSARRISAGEQGQAGLPTGGEVWEVALRLVRQGPFEVRASRSVHFVAETPLALASVGEAAAQRGTLAIRALGQSGLTITNRRLTSVPAELLQADRYQTARAAFHYQPARDELGAEPAVSIAPAATVEAESGAWAWTSRLETRFAVDGRRVHAATFCIQTAGQQQIRVSLPPEASLQAASLDDERLRPELLSAKKEPFLIDLPPGRGFVTLALDYATPGNLPALTQSEQPPFPKLDIPVMARQWSVWLPPGFQILKTDGRFSAGSAMAPTWTQRLFGVLGRDASTNVFNPLVAEAWRDVFAPGSENRAAHAACRDFVQSLGAVVAANASGEELTWGQLFASAGDAVTPSRRTLLVDAANLTRLGLAPQSRVHIEPGSSDLERGLALLKKTHLVLIAQSEACLITSSSAAASYAGQLAPSQIPGIHGVLPGPLADELRGATDRGQWSRFESIASWRTAPEQGQSPWTLDETDHLSIHEAPGWMHYTLELGDTSVPSIRIVHAAAMRSLSWALFLGLLAVGLAKGYRPMVLVMLVTVGICGSLVVAPAYVPLASAVVLAGLLCLALRMVRAMQPPDRAAELSRSSHKPRSSAVHPVAMTLFVAAILNLAAALGAAQSAPAGPQAGVPKGSDPVTPAAKPLAQPAASQAAPTEGSKGNASGDAAEPAPVYSVFVPVDARQQPEGGKVYIPKRLYQQLYQQAAAASGQPKGWLVTRCAYEGALARDSANKRLELTHLKASFELRVLQSDVRVRLPFAREGETEPIVGARLDGRSIPITRNAAGDELVIGPLAAEHYRLELDLRPPSQSDATTSGFDMAIPPLANATLELAVPQDAPTIELPAARGHVRLQKDRTKLVAQLGACQRLTTRWPSGTGMGSGAPNLEVEELIWVKVRPGTTVLDAKFKYRVLAGRVSQIRLLTDPRLRLLPQTATQSITAHTIPGDPQKIDLELPRPVSDEVVIDLSFLVTGTSGVGNLRLPRLETSGARFVKRWLGVSVDPALQYKVQAGEDSKQLELPQFATLWGASDAKPLSAYAIPRGEPMWGLATQPNEPQTTVDQTLVVSLGRNASLVRLDAALSISGGYLFQLGLQGPPDLVVEQVSLFDDGVERVGRWSTGAGGRITIFLTAPVNGQQRLSVRGRLATTQTDSFVVPQFQMLGATTRQTQLQLYRQPAVLAEVEPAPGLNQLDFPDGDAIEGFGARLGCFLVENLAAPVTVKLMPNVQHSRAVATTYLQRDAERWMADVEYHTEVSEGLVDSLEFEIPPQWSEPFRIEPATRFKIVPIPGELRRHMTIYPDKPIQGKYQVKINGRVALSAGDRLRVPDVLPLGSQPLERFVVMPQHLDLQQVTWDTIGLSRGALPADFAAHPLNAQSPAVYQVTGEHFQASLKAVQRTSASSRVTLADIQLVWQTDGSCQGVAAFDLEPEGTSSCVLELPSGHRLLHASVEGLPALLVHSEGNRWRLGLGPQQLPQRIEVIYTGPLPLSGEGNRFQAPRLAGLDVERTLWTIYGPTASGPGRSSDGASSIGAAEQDLYRMRNLALLMQLSPEIMGEHLPEEILRWYRPWKMRYSASRSAMQWELSAARQNNTQSEEELEASALDKQVKAVDARLGSLGPGARQSTPNDAAAQLIATSGASALPARFAVRGKSYDLDLNYPRAAFDDLGRRVLAAVTVLVTGCAIAMLLRNRSLRTFAPGLVIGVLGLAWWLLLSPSFVGLAALLVASWAAMRGRWQRNARPSMT
jgi:hypothetical protein